MFSFIHPSNLLSDHKLIVLPFFSSFSLFLSVNVASFVRSFIHLFVRSFIVAVFPSEHPGNSSTDSPCFCRIVSLVDVVMNHSKPSTKKDIDDDLMIQKRVCIRCFYALLAVKVHVLINKYTFLSKILNGPSLAIDVHDVVTLYLLSVYVVFSQGVSLSPYEILQILYTAKKYLCFTKFS